jgi:hypothetical protein
MYLHLYAFGEGTDLIITVPSMNYSGAAFAAALDTAMNESVQVKFATLQFKVSFNSNDNEITIAQLGDFYIRAYLVSSEDLRAGKYWSTSLDNSQIQSMNGILRIGKYTYMLQDVFPWKSYLDLFTTRNLYLTSSALASYSNISNFKTDVIVKKIPVTATFGQMMFYNATTGYDFLDVSRRSLTRIDFRLQDSYGNVVNLRGNHFSFSMVFAEK